jgi:hypothetical protein
MHVSKDSMWRGILKIFVKFSGTKLGLSTVPFRPELTTWLWLSFAWAVGHATFGCGLRLSALHSTPVSQPLPIRDSIYSTKIVAPVSGKWSGTRVHPLFLAGYMTCAISACMPAYEREAPAYLHAREWERGERAWVPLCFCNKKNIMTHKQKKQN